MPTICRQCEKAARRFGDEYYASHPSCTSYPKTNEGPELHLKLLAAEAPAILGWAVRGAIEVLANWLADPPAVIAPTKDYETSEETLARSYATNASSNQHGRAKSLNSAAATKLTAPKWEQTRSPPKHSPCVSPANIP